MLLPRDDSAISVTLRRNLDFGFISSRDILEEPVLNSLSWILLERVADPFRLAIPLISMLPSLDRIRDIFEEPILNSLSWVLLDRGADPPRLAVPLISMLPSASAVIRLAGLFPLLLLRDDVSMTVNF